MTPLLFLSIKQNLVGMAWKLLLLPRSCLDGLMICRRMVFKDLELVMMVFDSCCFRWVGVGWLEGVLGLWAFEFLCRLHRNEPEWFVGEQTQVRRGPGGWFGLVEESAFLLEAMKGWCLEFWQSCTSEVNWMMLWWLEGGPYHWAFLYRILWFGFTFLSFFYGPNYIAPKWLFPTMNCGVLSLGEVFYRYYQFRGQWGPTWMLTAQVQKCERIEMAMFGLGVWKNWRNLIILAISLWTQI